MGKMAKVHESIVDKPRSSHSCDFSGLETRVKLPKGLNPDGRFDTLL